MRDSGRRAMDMVIDELATYGVQPTFSRKRNRPVASFTLGGKQIEVTIPDGSVDIRAANNTKAHVRRLCRAHGLFPQGKPDPQPDVPMPLPVPSNDPEPISQPSNDPAPPIPQPENTADAVATANPVQAEVIPVDGAMLYVPRGPIVVLTASDDIIISKGEQLILDITGGRLLLLPPDKLESLYQQQGTTTLRDTLQSLTLQSFSAPPQAPASQPPAFQNNVDPAKAEQPDLIEPYPVSSEQPLVPETVTEPPPPHEILEPPPPPPSSEVAEPAAALAQEPAEPAEPAEAPVAGTHRGRYSRYGVGAQMGRVIVLMRQFHLRDRQSGRRQDRVTTVALRSMLSTKDVASLSTVMSKGQSAGLICKLGSVSKNGGSLHYFKLSPQGFFLANRLGDWPFEVVNETLPQVCS